MLRVLLIKMHRQAIARICKTEATVSTTGVTDSVRNTSSGAGTKDQMMVGIITSRNNTSPQTSKPNLYFMERR